MGELLIYGSYGYSGTLITQTAVREGLDPTLGGRRAERVEEQATEYDLDHRVFSLEHPEIVEREVATFDAVLNCAGPYTETAEPMVSACMATGTDYLDLAGNVDVLEWIAERDADATAADVALVPAVGFDVVPTDCLAATLHNAMPDATRLTLALDGFGGVSTGTARSVVRGLSTPGAVRVDGHIESVPAAYRRRTIPFESGDRTAVTVPWGDVSTAYYSTGVPNIEVYAAVPDIVADVMARSRPLTPVLGTEPVQRALDALVALVVSDPTADERARNEAHIWGEVVDESGEAVTARMRTPDTYDLTAATAVEAAARVLDGTAGSGFQTPASAFGPDFAEDFDGVDLEILDEREAVAQ